MKLLNGLLVLVIGLIVVGLIYFADREDEETPEPEGSDVTMALSLDQDIFKINQDENIIYILEGTVQEDILGNLVAQDGSPQTYRITTSEGTNKSFDLIYEYDRLYVTAENGVAEEFYQFEYVEALD
ncbi:MAG: hypothetical protein ACVCEJ_10200 [Candidatus Izemoplasmataceae bacterium]